MAPQRDTSNVKHSYSGRGNGVDILLERASTWAPIFRDLIQRAERSIPGHSPDPLKCSLLSNSYMELGIQDLVLTGSAAVMIRAFRAALSYWMMQLPIDTPMAIPILEMAILSRDVELERRVCRLVSQPLPGRDQMPEHHISCLLMIAIMGQGDPAPHQVALSRGSAFYVGYGKMLRSVLEGDAAGLKAGAEVYLKWHRPRALKGSLSKETVGLVAMPVITCLYLGKARGLDVRLDNPFVPMVAVD